MSNVTSTQTNEENAIANSLPGRAMRVAMENKDLLAGKGALYAGTGETNSFTVTGMDEGSVTYEIPITAATPTPTTTGTVLTYTGEGDTGLAWQSPEATFTLVRGAYTLPSTGCYLIFPNDGGAGITQVGGFPIYWEGNSIKQTLPAPDGGVSATVQFYVFVYSSSYGLSYYDPINQQSGSGMRFNYIKLI